MSRPLKLLLIAAALLAAPAAAPAQDLPTNSGGGAVPQEDLSPALAEGARLYRSKCGLCHIGFGPGTIMLGRRLGEAHAALAGRTDLKAAYVKGVARKGLNGMPAFTRVDLSDAELDEVAAYLSRHTVTP